MRRVALLVTGVLLLAGCSEPAAPTVSITVDGVPTVVSPAQYCLDGSPKLYADTTPDFAPPVLQVAADRPIEIEVPAAVADSGWQVQVFDEGLVNQIGQVPVGHDRRFDGISTSDAAPTAFFLVVIQDAGEACNGLAGAWPMGFVRIGGVEPDGTAPGTTAPGSTTPGSTTPGG